MTIDPRYLILRCHPRDTLPLAQRILPDLNLLCPTTVISVRKGPSRTRQFITIPILPSFLFLPLPHPPSPSPPSRDNIFDASHLDPSHILHIPPATRSRLHLMRRPTSAPISLSIFDTENPLPPEIPRQRPSTYAFCTLSEISTMMSSAVNFNLDPYAFQVGSRVEVVDGLLCGITGIVVQIRANGDITLKVQQHLGWQINTCIVAANVLRLL